MRHADDNSNDGAHNKDMVTGGEPTQENIFLEERDQGYHIREYVSRIHGQRF